MNTAGIKKYAPKARNNFIAAVTKQAARYGISAKGTEPMAQRGDIALIGEKAFPKAIAPARKALERMVEQMGFAQAMEQAAYSWFNRLCAIRYMEIHDFLDHGRRVLSTANGKAGTPQILDDCLDISLPGLDPQEVAELKLDGNKDEALYRELLLAQCHALHEAMPFLFEAVDDATELLLPDNLTKTDSLIRELVSAIPEDDWQDVEIIGWLYQFYISEKKDEVIGKVVKSEDIPAATQLFTPNWIVQYLAQNSVGRQWLQTYPDSPLRNQMPYFIEPGEQPPEVQAQLAETVPGAIDPETIKVLDPACGSGHILVEAYKILKAIYEERGYRSRDIPQQILKHNLFGLDIDDRAGQLAGFALMMLAREDDRRLFSRVAEGELTLNVLSLKETGHLNLPQLWQDLNLSGDWQQGSSQSLFENEQADLSSASADERYQLLQRTLERFEEAKTFGSLIEVAEEDAAPLGALVEELEHISRTGDVMQKPVAEMLLPSVQQAWILAQRYDAVIANPPYMGSKGMNAPLKKFAKEAYPNSKSDLFAIFMERGFELTKPSGNNAQVNMQSWMFSQSYEKLRKKVLGEKTISSLVHVGFNSFPTLNTKVVLASAFSILNKTIDNFRGTYVDLNSASPSQNKQILFETERETRTYQVAQKSFLGVPGCPISFWYDFSSLFSSTLLGQEFESGGRCKTHNDERYVRYHWEISRKDMFPAGRWKLYEKGGDYRKWYGNQYSVIDWQESSREHYKKKGGLTQERFWSREGITWSDIAIVNGFRLKPECSEYSSVSPTIFPNNSEKDLLRVLGFLNSSVAGWLLNVINPGIHSNPGDVLKLPLITTLDEELVRRAVAIVRNDWDREELSTGFLVNPIVSATKKTVRESVSFDFDHVVSLVDELSSIEKQNNKSLITTLGLIGQVSEEVESRLISLSSNPSYIAGKNLPLIEREERHRTVSIISLVSYAVGNMMGRYSLDQLGLMLASRGETMLDYLRQIPSPSFTPDDDAILPLTDQEWFADDATNRFREFIRAAWGDEHLQENLDFVAECLCLHAIKPKRGESALDTIRRYLSTQFFKDHLRTYKKRPIYWLFSSGKHKAFECLVYLHRYNEGTLARMRTEYVIPLSAKLNAYAEKLEQDKEVSTSAAETKRLEKEIATLHKQQIELAAFDEKLRHFADQRISLDLDDGVKVNYGKFGDLLAEVKAVTGEKPQ